MFLVVAQSRVSQPTAWKFIVVGNSNIQASKAQNLMVHNKQL